MPISDIFPDAGISFWDVAHETNGGLIADGYTRATGKMSMVVAQNGPGITGLVTPIKTAYWNHTPLLLVTPQAANKTMGQGGFQEVEQMNLFKDMVCYQEEVRDPLAQPLPVPHIASRLFLDIHHVYKDRPYQCQPDGQRLKCLRSSDAGQCLNIACL